MRRCDLDAWLRTVVLLIAFMAVLMGLSAVCRELQQLNAHLAAVEREVQRNTAAQERVERLAVGALKSFGSGIE